MQKNQRDTVLVAIHDEARRFFRGFGVDHAAEFDPLVVGVRRVWWHVLFLIGHDADCPATDTRIAAEQRLAILGAIFVERLPSTMRAMISLHVILLCRIAG